LVPLRCHEVHIREDKRGERLKPDHLQAGDVAVGDQGDCASGGILESVWAKGAEGIVRWHHRLPL
jgi:hypothetical protein